MTQGSGIWRKYAREGSVALALMLLLAVVGAVAPSFFTLANLRDLVLGNLPVFIVAVGMTILIIAGQIDISVGAQFACASVVAGWLAKSGVPVWLLIPLIGIFGALLGALNGLLVARFSMPSIVVTLAMMVALRDLLRWITAGEWVQGLPADFQWFGIGQTAGEWLLILSAAANMRSIHVVAREPRLRPDNLRSWI